MKKGIHPEYFPKAKVKCSCGNIFEIGSTLKEIKVEVCSACHPFYTGNDKLVDTAGRVEKFKAKIETAKTKQEEKTKTKKNSIKTKKGDKK